MALNYDKDTTKLTWTFNKKDTSIKGSLMGGHCSIAIYANSTQIADRVLWSEGLTNANAEFTEVFDLGEIIVDEADKINLCDKTIKYIIRVWASVSGYANIVTPEIIEHEETLEIDLPQLNELGGVSLELQSVNKEGTALILSAQITYNLNSELFPYHYALENCKILYSLSNNEDLESHKSIMEDHGNSMWIPYDTQVSSTSLYLNLNDYMSLLNKTVYMYVGIKAQKFGGGEHIDYALTPITIYPEKINARINMGQGFTTVTMYINLGNGFEKIDSCYFNSGSGFQKV